MADEQFATAQGTPKAEPDTNGDNGEASDATHFKNGSGVASADDKGARSAQGSNGEANGEASGKENAAPENAPDIKLGADNDEELPCEISHGLSSDEAARLLKEHGPNELPEKKTPSWLVFLNQMKAPMPIMIWIAIIIELGIQNWIDAAILLGIQLTNATIGWYETMKSGKAVAALKASLKPEATAKRDGKMVTISATELVPGDCVLLGSGGAVPADCMVNEGRVEIDQAALTGESLPVKMTKGGQPKMGSTVVRGEVEATVQFTGVNTFFGKTADMLNSEKGMDHLQKTLLTIVFILTITSIILVVTCFIYIWAKFGSGVDAIEFAVVVLVASIPLALEIVVTTTLALGSRVLAKDGAIVTRLAAIEDLSGMNILCSDKTGTLTMNKMVIQDDCPTFMPDLDQAKVLVLAALAAKWREPPRDALDTLVLNAVDLEECDKYEQLDFTPFDPSTKYTSALLKGPDGKVFRTIKGAPQVILKKAGNMKKEAVEEAVSNYGGRGIRTLAVGVTDDDSENFKFAALLTFLDPPREDTKDTIHEAYRYGIDVKMVTGDQVLIARETSRVLAMGDNVLEPDDLPDFNVGEDVPKDLGEKYGQMCFEADGFAQVYPEHKFLIVEALRQMGFGVGMTGDGVNDAPALKQADVGIAVEGATDAARAASDIVLSQPGLSTIIKGIEVAREIFQRMQNFLTYRIAATVQLIMFFFVALFAFPPRDFQPPLCNLSRAEPDSLVPAPCVARPPEGLSDAALGRFEEEWSEHAEWPEYFFLPVILLILITLLNDGTMIAIGYDHVIAPTRPAKWNLPALFFVSCVMAAFSCLSSLILLYFALTSHESGSVFEAFALPYIPYGKIVTLMYLKVAVSDFLTLFSARTGDKFFWATRPATMLLIGAAISLAVSTLIACVWGNETLDERPITGLARFGYGLWPIWVWLYCLVVFVLQDIGKVLTYRAMERFDLFHYHSGAMVATRDHHDFEHPGGKLAAGHVETKALDAALRSGQTNMETLARNSTQHGAALNRVSQSIALSRQSLQTRPGGGGALGRKSLVTVGEASTMNDVSSMHSQLVRASAALPQDVQTGVQPDLDRVSAAVSNLQRVSAAVDRQRLGRPSRISRRSVDSKGAEDTVPEDKEVA